MTRIIRAPVIRHIRYCIACYIDTWTRPWTNTAEEDAVRDSELIAIWTGNR